MNKWELEQKQSLRRRLGKLVEECGELVQIAGRILIQGVGANDPKTKKPNRVSLIEEMADVQCQLDCLRRELDLSREEYKIYNQRVNDKIEKQLLRESMYSPAEQE